MTLAVSIFYPSAITGVFFLAASELGGGGSNATLVGQIVLFATTVIGIWVGIYRENRNRRWAIEDSERRDKKIEAEAQKVREEAIAQAARIAAEVKEEASRVKVETQEGVNRAVESVEKIVEERAEEARRARDGINSKLDQQGKELAANTALTKDNANGGGKHLSSDAVHHVIVDNDQSNPLPVEPVSKETARAANPQ